MTDIKNLLFFQRTLLIWFEVNKRLFSWRQPNLTYYQIIISEILLQRTKAETVSKFYERFICSYPNWQSLHDTNVSNIEALLRPIGLSKQRASRLHKLAKYMVENNELIPENRSELDTIPFMGQYIANAVELQIFNRRLPLLDVNMARVLERFFGPRRLADIRYDPYLQDLALKVVNHMQSKELNWAILDFSALICKARKPSCSICPLSVNCLNYKSHSADC